MKKLIFILSLFCSVAYGQNNTFTLRSSFGNPEGVTQGYADSKRFCYYLYFNPEYKQFHDDENTILRMMMQFDLHVDEKSYDKWVQYTKQKYEFTDCIVMDIKVVHKDGTEEVYTFDGFRKILWP